MLREIEFLERRIASSHDFVARLKRSKKSPSSVIQEIEDQEKSHRQYLKIRIERLQKELENDSSQSQDPST